MQGKPELYALIQRLSSGKRTAQAQAAGTLAGLATAGGAAACEAIVAAGAVGPLVQLARSDSAALQRQAAKALNELAHGAQGTHAAIVAAGGLHALVPLLGCGDGAAEAAAVEALTDLTFQDKQRCEVVAAAGAAPHLARLCRGAGPAQVAAAALCCNLTNTQLGVEAVAAAGGVEALTSLLNGSSAGGGGGSGGGGGGGGSGGSSLADNALTALGNLAQNGGSGMQAALLAAGTPAALVRLAQRSCAGKEREAVVRALYCFTCHSQPQGSAAVVAAGGVAVLARLLANDDGRSTQARAFAAGTLGNLACDSEQWCMEVLAAGCIPHLVQLLGGGDPAFQATAAGALGNITASGGAAVAAAVAAAGGHRAALGLLRDRAASSVVLQCGITLLVNLALDGQLTVAEAAEALVALQPLLNGDQAVGERADAASQALSLYLLRAAAGAGPAGGAPQADAAAAEPATGRQPPPPPPQQQQQQQQQQPARRACAAPSCGATTGLRRCGGCAAVRYCSEACSKAHWRAHKAECRRVQAQRAAAAQGSASGEAAGSCENQTIN